MKYWDFTNNIKWTNGKALRQIRAVRTFSNGRIVEEGELGGWIDDASTLSQTGAWIEEGSEVMTGCRVLDSAWIGGSSRIEFNCVVKDAARVVDSDVFDHCVLKDSFRCRDCAINNFVTAGGGSYFLDVVANGRATFEDDGFVKSVRIRPRNYLSYKRFFNGIYQSKNVSFYVDDKKRLGKPKRRKLDGSDVWVGVREPYGFATDIAVPFREFYQKCRARNRSEKWSAEYRNRFVGRLRAVLKALT